MTDGEGGLPTALLRGFPREIQRDFRDPSLPGLGSQAVLMFLIQWVGLTDTPLLIGS